MSPIHAVIIAGGTGQRLGGVRKGDIRIGGLRLIERVAAAMGPVETLLVAVGPTPNETRIPPPNLPLKRGRDATGAFGEIAIPDLDAPVGGPLAGLAAAVDYLARGGVTDGLLLSSSVDTPFLPDDYASVLAQALEDAAAGYAAWGDQFYPPNALWRLSALQALPDKVRANAAPASLKALLRMLGAVEVDWQARATENPFANLNTVGDLVSLGRRAKNAPLSRLIHKRDD
nr:NTP transferase domain-containing protein [uncultured Devosia sp.]